MWGCMQGRGLCVDIWMSVMIMTQMTERQGDSIVLEWMTLMWGCRQGRVRPGPSGRGWQSNEVSVIPSRSLEDHNQNPEYFKVRARSLLSFKLAKLSGFESQLEEVSVSMFSGENFNQFRGCKDGCQCLQVKITLSRSRDRKSNSHTPPVRCRCLKRFTRMLTRRVHEGDLHNAAKI